VVRKRSRRIPAQPVTGFWSFLFRRLPEYSELEDCKRRSRRDTRDGKAHKTATHWFEVVELDRGSVIVGGAVYHSPELFAV
jgi:hypothetical protein